MLLEWEFSAKERTYSPRSWISRRSGSGRPGISRIRLEDGTRVPVEITNRDTAERYRARPAVTSNGELYIPVEVQKLIQEAASVRVELL